MDGIFLQDVVKAIIDCPHSTPRWTDSGIYAIRNYNLVNGDVDLSHPSYVSEEEYNDRTNGTNTEYAATVNGNDDVNDNVDEHDRIQSESSKDFADYDIKEVDRRRIVKNIGSPLLIF